MNKIEPQTDASTSGSTITENIARLRALFPEAFGESGIKFDVLKQLLGGPFDDEGGEKYGLYWHGKRRAMQNALTPSLGTLRPCPGESVDWDTTQNLMIEGDNLEVLKLLRRSYQGKVKMIYIDPPYNTGNDFVYPDDFKDGVGNYLRITGQVGEDGGKLTSNSEASGRFHTNWLNMMYPRLKVAKELLAEDGVIFVSIDDQEVQTLKTLLLEIFGEENFVAHIVWQKRYVANATARLLSDMHDHVLMIARALAKFDVRLLGRTEEQLQAYKNPDGDPRGVWRAQDLSASKPYAAGRFRIVGPTGLQFDPPPGRYWRCSESQYQNWLADGRITFGVAKTGRPMLKSFLTDAQDGVRGTTWWSHDLAGHNKEATLEIKALFEGEPPFDTAKPTKLVGTMLRLLPGNGDIILDFFAGSGTTGHAVMAQNAADRGNRRYICVQLPEPLDPDNKDQKLAADFCDKLGKPRTIAELTKERLRRAGAKIKAENPLFPGDTGFRVFKLATSNIKPWDPRPDDLGRQVEDWIENIRPDRTEQDLLYELLLKLGLDLSVPIVERTIADKRVQNIGSGTLIVCLERPITRTDVEALGLGLVAWAKEQKPVGGTSFVFRDSAFEDDVAKTNLDAILRQNLQDGALAAVRSL